MGYAIQLSGVRKSFGAREALKGIDLSVEEGDIFGDGVNLAARIQAIAEPGGIAVSRAVRDLVELRVEYAFHDGGEHQLKNVSRSVQVFHVRPARQAPLQRAPYSGAPSKGLFPGETVPPVLASTRFGS